MSIRSRSSPSGARASRSNVCTNRPAPTTSSSDSATCATISPPDQPPPSPPTSPGIRPCSRNASIGATLVARSAGIMPNPITVAASVAAVNSEHAPVERQIEGDGIRGRVQLGQEKAGRPPREHRPADRAGGGQHRALREHQTREPPRRSAERQADAQLVPPRRAARQQQVGDVDAGDQQHERDDDQQGDQRPLEPLAQSRRAVGDRLELEGSLRNCRLRERRHRRGAHLRLHRAQRRGRRLELSPPVSASA